MNNRHDRYRQYDIFQDADYRREGTRRKGAPTALVIVLALAAGFVGGSLSRYLFQETEPPAVSATAIQSASSQEGSKPVEEGSEAASAPPAEETAPSVVHFASIAEGVAAKAGPSVVEVSTESKATHPFFGSYVTGGAGSGVILTEDGYIVTNHHVIDGSTSISIRTSDGMECAAQLIASDRQTDLAVLKVDAAGLCPATLADSDDVVIGQPVVAIGNPLGTLGGTVTEGIISAKDREIMIDEDEMVLLQTSAAINPGNSGGGLFDGDSLLVGVVNAKSSGSNIEGLGFAIPANTVKHVVSQLILHGYVTDRPSLGIEIVDINSRDALYYYRVSDYGVYVLSVGGQDNPLQSGDRLLQVGDARISAYADVKREVNRHKVGDSIPVSIQRGGRVYQVTVVLQERALASAELAA